MLFPLIVLSSLPSCLLAIHVAFVIAGSPRSFIYPAIHESIRVNLISAFCPMDSCSADIFVRVSLSDNTHMVDGHAVTDGKGVSIAADEKELPLVRHALHRLHLAVRGVVNATWVDVGSVAEQEEMKAHFNSSRHRVFRELDPRRYSMYFGRWSAYQQAKNYEREHGLHYTWFVHTRFDMAFGAPIQPYSHWSSNKLWVHDMWAADVPDIFALIPSKFADAYFSMDLLVQETAMCLGGPNFNKTSVEDSALIKIGFNKEERDLAREVVCKILDDGWSERILKRKLLLAEISLGLNKIGFVPIFSAVFRKNLIDFCQYLHPAQMIGWLWDSQKANGAMYSGCVHFAQDVRREAESPRCTSLPLMSDDEYAGYGCFLAKNVSGWNYMPYRIRLPPRLGGQCLTASQNNGTNSYSLSFAPCIQVDTYQLEPRIRHAYSITQLFRFHVADSRPQRVGLLDYRTRKSDSWRCLSNSRNTRTIISLDGQLHARSQIARCNDYDQHQLFNITVRVPRQKRRKRQSKRRLSFDLLTIANDGNCLSYSISPDGAYAIPFWAECRHQPQKKGESSVRQVFVLERTYVSNSSPKLEP